MALTHLLCCPQNDSVTVGFLSATSDVDLELLQDFDLSEFEGLFGRSENDDESNNSSTTSVGSIPAEGALQATPTQPKTNQEAENAEQPSEAQQVKKKSETPAEHMVAGKCITQPQRRKQTQKRKRERNTLTFLNQFF